MLVDKRPARIPPPMKNHDQLEYDLSDFTPERREAVTFWLVTSEIPFEWEPDGLLVVPSKWQLEVDAIVESMEHPDAGRAGRGRCLSRGDDRCRSARRSRVRRADSPGS